MLLTYYTGLQYTGICQYPTLINQQRFWGQLHDTSSKYHPKQTYGPKHNKLFNS